MTLSFHPPKVKLQQIMGKRAGHAFKSKDTKTKPTVKKSGRKNKEKAFQQAKRTQTKQIYKKKTFGGSKQKVKKETIR